MQAMPTTRAPRAAARTAARCLTEVLPADALGLVLYQLTLAHDIAAVAPTCHALSDAAKLALKLRPFSGEVVTLAGHTQLVFCVAVTPGGGIITGCDDGHLRLWSRVDAVWTCTRDLEAHTVSENDPYINGVAVLPGGARFVSAGEDDTVKLWAIDGTLERTFDLEDWATSVAALPDGVHFVVGARGWLHDDADDAGIILMYHVDGTLVFSFAAHTYRVNVLAVMPDGHHIISGSEDGLVKVWSVAAKSLVCNCEGHTGIIGAVAVMPDGKRILSGSFDKSVRVWRFDGTLKTNALENTFADLHASMVLALVALPDNKHALSGSRDKTAKLFNVNDNTILRTFTHHTGAVQCLALLPDGLRFISGSDDNTARIVEHGLALQ